MEEPTEGVHTRLLFRHEWELSAALADLVLSDPELRWEVAEAWRASPLTEAEEPGAESLRWYVEGVLPWLLLIGGLIVTWAALMLSIEVFDRLKDPNYVPVCNLNPILSCTSVADSNQAHAFGFPNYFLGLAGYAAIATVGATLLAGAKFKRWFWQLFEAGLLFAALFMTWLQFETLYRIGALCIFCMVLWVFTWPMFWYTTLYNLQKGHIKLSKKLNRPVAFLRRHHADVLVLWYVIIILLILHRFWYYWKTLV